MNEDEEFWDSLIDGEAGAVEVSDNYPYKFIRFWLTQAVSCDDITTISSYDILKNYVKTDFVEFTYSLDAFLTELFNKNIFDYDFSIKPSKSMSMQELNNNDINNELNLFSIFDFYNISVQPEENKNMKKWNSAPNISMIKKADYKALEFFNYLFSLPERQMIYVLFKGPSLIPAKYKEIYIHMFMKFNSAFRYDFPSVIRHFQHKFQKNSFYNTMTCHMDQVCQICSGQYRGFVCQHENCELFFCETCLHQYVNFQVKEIGNIHISCMHSECNYYFPFTLVWELLSEQNRELFQTIKNLQSESKTYKRCPNCLIFYQLSQKEIKDKKRYKGVKYRRGFNVVCNKCHFNWCFKCQSPVHEDTMTCRQNRSSDKKVKSWANERVLLQENHLLKRARNCPKCGLLTEKNGGCLHMRCLNCDIDWCFSCGNRMYEIKSIPGFNHRSTFTFFGCKRLIKNPFKRILIRSCVLTGCVIVVPIALPLLIGLSPIIIGVFACVTCALRARS